MFMKLKVLLGAAIMAMALVMASTALADPTGYLEICKASDSSAPVSGPFHYTVDGTISVTVQTGGCSSALSVPAGTATVVEDSHPFYAETAAATIPQDALVSSDLATQTQHVTVAASTSVSTATTLTVTNKEVFGTMEICKNAQAGSGLTGTFTFRVTGPFGFSKTVAVPVGACSASFQVPAGVDEVDEIGTNDTDVVSETTVPANDLVTDNLAAGTSQVRVAAGGVANETIVTFTNSTSRLKICKVAGTASLDGTVYSFTANGATVTAVAGPAPGNCVLVPTPFPGGTRVDIQEGVVPGTAVTGIAVTDNRAVAGSTDLANRKVSVVLGSGETIVTYTNNAAAPGLLKVCKNAGTGVTVGRSFTFHIGAQTVNVPAGFCAIAGSFAFNSSQTITEDATAGLSVTAESVDPAAEEVSASLSGRSITTLIGDGVTEVAFTNATTGTSATAPSTGSSTSATTPAPTVVPTSTSPITVVPTPVVEKVTTPAAAPKGCTVSAHLVLVRTRGHGRKAGLGAVIGRPELVLVLRGSKASCKVLLREYSGQGKLLVRQTRQLHQGHVVRIMLGLKVQRVRATIVK
jgi:hypothetical protein